VRRLLAISLLLLFGFPLISPLFALTANAEMNLPACCRRNGAHHCSMSLAERGLLAGQPGAKTPVVGERCAYLPKALPGFSNSSFALDTSSSVFAEVVARPAIVPQMGVKRRSLRSRSSLKRGPPALRA
jgi:hypothetical protein